MRVAGQAELGEWVKEGGDGIILSKCWAGKARAVFK